MLGPLYMPLSPIAIAVAYVCGGTHFPRHTIPLGFYLAGGGPMLTLERRYVGGR